jgi:hypothetical protein
MRGEWFVALYVNWTGEIVGRVWLQSVEKGLEEACRVHFGKRTPFPHTLCARSVSVRVEYAVASFKGGIEILALVQMVRKLYWPVEAHLPVVKSVGLA